jgi:methyl-accepting chemotaxis protein
MIVKSIDEIAFQTNLLALNAAVEAARAGDAGKGFAVVAEEVRNLAMRSAAAAKSTAQMIEDSLKNADNGVRLNDEVLRNLSEISGQVNRLSEMMAEINAASGQQSEGIEQINVSMEQMNQLTQQNAANAEESAGAAQELSHQAEQMKMLVTSFTLSSAGLDGARGASMQPRSVASPSKPRALKPPAIREERGLMKVGYLKRGGNGDGGGDSAHPMHQAPFIPLDDDEIESMN